jgi:hypothetical protein
MVYPVHPRIEFDEATLVRLHTSDARVTLGNAILAKIPNSRPLVLPSDGYGIAAAEADQCETNVSCFDKSGASGRQKQLKTAHPHHRAAAADKTMFYLPGMARDFGTRPGGLAR